MTWQFSYGGTIYEMQDGWFRDDKRNDFEGSYYLFSADEKTEEAPGTDGLTVASNLPELLFVNPDGSGPTYDSNTRPTGYSGDNISIDIHQDFAVLRDLPDHPFREGVSAKDQTLRNIEALYWEGSRLDDNFTVNSLSGNASLRTLFFAGLEGDDKVSLLGSLQSLDGKFEGSPISSPHSFAGGEGTDELVLDFSSQGSFVLEYMVNTTGFGNASVENLVTRFSITGGNGFRFNAVDVERIKFVDTTFDRENVFLASPEQRSVTGTNYNDYLTGNGKDNSLVSDAGDDVALGLGGNDDLNAASGAGNDYYDGGTGVDTIRYGSAKNSVTINLATGSAKSTASSDAAGIGVDIVKNIENVIGGNYNDLLTGNSALNTFNGGGGNDNLNGGLGKDSLTGSTGVDKFIYRSTADSRVGSAVRDVITDFRKGAPSEKIDLSAIDAYAPATGNQAFTYIGSNAFTGTKGEARFSGGILQMNTGADKSADMEIALTGVTTFSSTFLVL